jgi:hypothetical protein
MNNGTTTKDRLYEPIHTPVRMFEQGQPLGKDRVWLCHCLASVYEELPYVSKKVLETFETVVKGVTTKRFHVSVLKEELDCWMRCECQKVPMPTKFYFAERINDRNGHSESNKKREVKRKVTPPPLRLFKPVVKKEDAPKILVSDPMIETYQYDLSLIIHGTVTVSMVGKMERKVKVPSGTYPARKRQLEGEMGGLWIVLRMKVEGADVEIGKHHRQWMQYTADHPLATVTIQGLD